MIFSSVMNPTEAKRKMNKEQKDLLKLILDDALSMNKSELKGDNLYYYELVVYNLQDLIKELKIDTEEK